MAPSFDSDPPILHDLSGMSLFRREKTVGTRFYGETIIPGRRWRALLLRTPGHRRRLRLQDRDHRQFQLAIRPVQIDAHFKVQLLSVFQGEFEENVPVLAGRRRMRLESLRRGGMH